MEELNKDEILEKLQEQVAEDLKDAQVHEWAIDKEDAMLVTRLKNDIYDNIKGIKDTIAFYDTNIQDNENRMKVWNRVLEANVLSAEDTESVKKDIEEIDKTNVSILEAKKKFEDATLSKLAILEKISPIFNYKIDENGKAYYDNEIILFAHYVYGA